MIINKFTVDDSETLYKYNGRISMPKHDLDANNFEKRNTLNANEIQERGNFSEYEFYIYRESRTLDEWKALETSLRNYDGKVVDLYPDEDNPSIVRLVYWSCFPDSVNDNLEKLYIKVRRVYPDSEDK